MNLQVINSKLAQTCLCYGTKGKKTPANKGRPLTGNGKRPQKGHGFLGQRGKTWFRKDIKKAK